MPVFLRHHRLLTGSVAAFVLLLAWDALGPDLALARLFGTPTGFPGRNSWLLSTLLHDRARDLGRLMLVLLALAIWFPVGVLRQLSRAERAGLFAGTLLSLLAVSVVKNLSTTSCPWDLAEFGGVARHVSHWAWQVRDGGDGRCFPAGHASAGFAFVAGYFWLRGTAPAAARIWLSVALAAGLFLGLVQQVRGAHYMSHTLWTAWVCWVTSAAVWWLAQGVAAWRARRHQGGA